MKNMKDAFAEKIDKWIEGNDDESSKASLEQLADIVLSDDDVRDAMEKASMAFKDIDEFSFLFEEKIDVDKLMILYMVSPMAILLLILAIRRINNLPINEDFEELANEIMS